MSSWVLGGGGGAHIGLGERATLNIQLLALYHWFDERVRIVGKEGPQDGYLEFPIFQLAIGFLI
jgi:hypothetical protein